VGNQFVVLDNLFILNFVHEHLLAKFDGLEIESVGTLFNGATSFINLKLAEFQIKGDQSPTLSRLMYYNPLGMGAYKAGAHSIRIVCNNTLRAASGEAAANKTLAKFRHTRTAGERINGHLEELASVQLGLKEQVDTLDLLASKPVTETMVKTYMEKLFPTQDNGKPKEGRSLSLAVNKQEEVLAVFEKGEAMTRETATSAYGLLQATTYYYDHNTIRNGDTASRMWDGMVGDRAKKKDTAFKMLVDLAV
jgi:hypothetical protein